MSVARHFAEMLAAMLLGMALVHPLVELSGGAGPLVLAAGMTLPMAALMRHRDQRWGEVAEVMAAMGLLALAVLPLGGAAALHALHAAMVPVMLVVVMAQARRSSPRSSRSISLGCSRTSP